MRQLEESSTFKALDNETDRFSRCFRMLWTAPRVKIWLTWQQRFYRIHIPRLGLSVEKCFVRISHYPISYLILVLLNHKNFAPCVLFHSVATLITLKSNSFPLFPNPLTQTNRTRKLSFIGIEYILPNATFFLPTCDKKLLNLYTNGQKPLRQQTVECFTAFVPCLWLSRTDLRNSNSRKRELVLNPSTSHFSKGRTRPLN